MTGRPLVFVSCGATTAPLVRLLGRWATIVVPDAGIAARLADAGVEALDWQAAAGPSRLAAIGPLVPRTVERWAAALARETDTVLAAAGPERRRRALDDITAHLRARTGEHLIAWELGRSLAGSGRLAAAVVHEDVTGLIRAFLLGVQAHGVPTVHVPHGLYAEAELRGANVHDRAWADVLAVGGAAQRKWFVRRGVPGDRIVETGNPAWDLLCRHPRVPAESLGLARGRVVTLALSWIGPDNAGARILARAFANHVAASLTAVKALRRTEPSLRCVVKLHPSAPATEEERVRRLAAAAGVTVDLATRGRTHEILAASDVLVTQPSTIAAEALILGTPVVAIDCAYDGDAVLAVPGEAAAVEAAVGHVLAGWGRSEDFQARRRTFLRRHNGPSDGGAAERVAALVEDQAARARAARTADEQPGDREQWTLRAETLSRLGLFAEAEASYRRALSFGAHAPAFAGLGLLLLERGAEKAAEECLQQARTLDPANDWAWCGLGVLAGLRGQTGEAARLLTQALTLNPANTDARSALAALAREGEAGAR
jgi:hypothetical protein